MVLACAIGLLATIGISGCYRSQEIPAEIVGDSMAPLLCGRRKSYSCRDCRFSFETSRVSPNKEIVCPCCGNRITGPARELAADQVTVDPGRRPDRWDVVAFEHQGKTMVKRVVGLPGETVDIQFGNILIDGMVMPKTAVVLDQVKQLVFDSDYRSRRTTAAIDRSLDYDSDRWQRDDNRWVHPENAGLAVDWITYRHQIHRRPKSQSRFKSDPDVQSDLASPAENRQDGQIENGEIQDDSGYNPSVTRLLHEVDDLVIEIDAQLEDGVPLHLHRRFGRRHDCHLTLRVDLEADRIKGVLFINGTQEKFSCQLSNRYRRSKIVSLSLSNIDRRLMVAIERSQCVELALGGDDPWVAEETFDPRSLIRFGFAGNGKGRVDRLRIWRDVYYFMESGLPQFRLPVSLLRGQYFVLGDNVAVSSDSRHFGPVEKMIGTINVRIDKPE